ncbi:MAG: hypothetical protein RBS17_02375 [Coriobacteriia bacterium]|nr:hypothetical protein [Coriobacteriia bacterium]
MNESRQGLKPRTIALIVLGSLLAIIAAAWGTQLLLTSPEDIAPLQVTREGTVLAEYSMEELRDFPSRSFTQFGKSEEGSGVLDVLAKAGVTEFERLTVYGLGIRDDGVLVLTRDQVAEDVLLDFANRGTVKIAGPDIEWGDRVRDVTILEVE